MFKNKNIFAFDYYALCFLEQVHLCFLSRYSHAKISYSLTNKVCCCLFVSCFESQNLSSRIWTTNSQNLGGKTLMKVGWGVGSRGLSIGNLRQKLVNKRSANQIFKRIFQKSVQLEPVILSGWGRHHCSCLIQVLSSISKKCHFQLFNKWLK